MVSDWNKKRGRWYTKPIWRVENRFLDLFDWDCPKIPTVYWPLPIPRKSGYRSRPVPPRNHPDRWSSLLGNPRFLEIRAVKKRPRHVRIDSRVRRYRYSAAC